MAQRVTKNQLESLIWTYDLLGRHTLSSPATTLTVNPISARKFLKVIFIGIASGGNLATNMRFNNDSSNNYSLRLSDSGAAHGVFTSQNSITLDPANNTNSFSIIDIINIQAAEKQIEFNTHMAGAAGAGNQTASRQGWPKWANTSNQITRIDIFTSANNFGAGSDLIILGKD